MLLSFSRILWGLLWKVFWLTNCGFKCHSIKTHYEPKRKHRPKLLAVQCMYEWIIIERLFYAFTFVNISILTDKSPFLSTFSLGITFQFNQWRLLYVYIHMPVKCCRILIHLKSTSNHIPLPKKRKLHIDDTAFVKCCCR